MIGLRALEILVDERSGFTEFALRHASGAAARIRLATQISALSSTLLPIVLEVVRSSDAQVILHPHPSPLPLLFLFSPSLLFFILPLCPLGWFEGNGYQSSDDDSSIL